MCAMTLNEAAMQQPSCSVQPVDNYARQLVKLPDVLVMA